MLVLSRHMHERIIIGADIIIQVVGMDHAKGTVRLGITAPREVEVHREEVALRIERNEPRKGGVA